MPELQFRAHGLPTDQIRRWRRISFPASIVIVIVVLSGPKANDDLASVDEGQSVKIHVVSNDSPLGGRLDLNSLAIEASPQHGDVKLLSDGYIQYSHRGSETTSDRFAYSIRNWGRDESSKATVGIQVNPQNDKPIAHDGTYRVLEGGEVTIKLLDLVGDEETKLTGSHLTMLDDQDRPAHAVGALLIDPLTGRVHYVHDGSEEQADQFRYRVVDSQGEFADATIAIEVDPVNDPPIAKNIAVSVDAHASVSIELSELATDPDPEDQILNPTIVEGPDPQQGEAVIFNGSLIYTHHGDLRTSADSLTFNVEDLSGTKSNLGTISIKVIVRKAYTFDEDDEGWRLSKASDMRVPEHQSGLDRNGGYVHTGVERLAAEFQPQIDIVIVCDTTYSMQRAIVPIWRQLIQEFEKTAGEFDKKRELLEKVRIGFVEFRDRSVEPHRNRVPAFKDLESYDDEDEFWAQPQTSTNASSSDWAESQYEGIKEAVDMLADLGNRDAEHAIVVISDADAKTDSYRLDDFADRVDVKAVQFYPVVVGHSEEDKHFQQARQHAERLLDSLRNRQVYQGRSGEAKNDWKPYECRQTAPDRTKYDTSAIGELVTSLMRPVREAETERREADRQNPRMWKAPKSFGNVLSGAHGMTLEFELRQSTTTGHFPAADVTLVETGGDRVLVYQLRSLPTTDWTLMEVPLRADPRWKLRFQGEERAVTDEEFRQVLRSNPGLAIRAEYSDEFNHRVSLDNVTLVEEPFELHAPGEG